VIVNLIFRFLYLLLGSSVVLTGFLTAYSQVWLDRGDLLLLLPYGCLVLDGSLLVIISLLPSRFAFASIGRRESGVII